MEDARYQLDLLKAINQKLNQKERMYLALISTSERAFLYIPADREEVVMLGNCSTLFPHPIRLQRDLPRAEEAFGSEYREKFLQTLYPERDGLDRSELELETEDHRSWYLMRVQLVSEERGKPRDKVVSFQNITKQKALNSELYYMAYYDNLTGLYNRNYFVSLLGQQLRRADEEKCSVAVLMVDLDDFKKLNDSMGLIVGDEVLQQFGSFLHSLEDEQVIACHMTNDVYAVSAYSPVGLHAAESIYERIRERLSQPFRLSTSQSIKMTASVGVAIYPDAASNVLDLLNCAEIVTYRAKQQGKDRMLIFEAPILDTFLQSVELENRLKTACAEGQFEMYYQPQYRSGNRALRGAEALIRWRDGKNGMISPDVFIPIAEKNRSIIEIGKFVLEETIRQYSIWSEAFGCHFVLSINISPLQYKAEGFVDLVMGTIHRFGVDPADIELEITEGILIDDFDAVSRKLNILRNYGIRISLDDFGTGYSSLAYLKRFPIDTLKVDKSFVDTVLSDSSTRVITESILSMSRALGFETVAEGVETENQYRYLHSAGCDIIQGYYLGRPLPASDFEKLLSSFSREEELPVDGMDSKE
ncbi:MAG: bifunctional diguanylate cyclase/phosphodiesterase [Lachnospiraceae bacterium]|nr:bifunctional diguanylate cyclase/phosphodiesterase [Lachnospiraceae bacterium]